jgi:putative phosphoesterase
MRIAVVSDVHGNLTALEAVIADLQSVSPDLVIQGGDLVGNGGRIAEIVDLIQERGWPSVLGNTDEMLWEPRKIDRLAERLPTLQPLWSIIREDIDRAIHSLGDRRLAWLRALPMQWQGRGITVVHASPGDAWNSPRQDASDEELARIYGGLRTPIVVYGHLHAPFIRTVGELMVANSGSVGLPHDADPRASYLLIDDGAAAVRRVEYDVEREIRDRAATGYPRIEWVGTMLRAGSYAPPDSAAIR